jgi:hypothetical protein
VFTAQIPIDVHEGNDELFRLHVGQDAAQRTS